MKNLFKIFSFLLFSVYGEAAVLDISGWTQQKANGQFAPVRITSVAAGEVPFFTGTAGSVDARKITLADVVGAGTTVIGTFASPITNNPYSVTWPNNEDCLLHYGANGTITLPVSAASAYAGKTIGIISTGTFSVTVDPNGSEEIYENGASLGAGTADVTAMTIGQAMVFTAVNGYWIKQTGGVAALTPWVENIDAAGYNLSNVGALTATTLAGDGTGVTNLQAPYLTGAIPDLTTGTLTTSEARVVTPTAGVSNEVVTTNGETTIVLDATTETLTYSTTPATGTYFTYTLTGHSADCTVTIPSTYSAAMMGARTTYVVPANKKVSIIVRRDAGEYIMWGDPVTIGDLTEDTTPAASAKVEIDQGSGGQYTSLANIRDAMGVTFNGSFATPNTDNPEAVSFTTSTFYHICGATQELDIEAASGYAGRGIVIYFDGTYTVTVDPVASAVIYINGTAMAADEKLIIDGTAGQIAILTSDGTNWSTAGGSATFSQETP